MKLLNLFETRVVKTLNGTTIKRSKYGVGKDIGGDVYLHKQYESVVPYQDALAKAKTKLDGFKYNVLKFDKTGNFTFFMSPDFDTADEPVAGKYVRVSKDGTVRSGETKNIWHHKWLWVKDTYNGFNVEKSFNHSQAWLKIPDIDFTRIGNKEFWEKHVVSKF